MFDKASRDTLSSGPGVKSVRYARIASLAGLTAAALLFAAAGCEAPAGGTSVFASRSSTNLSSRRLDGVSFSELRGVADRIFRQRFHVDAANSTPDVWVAQPQEVTREEPGRLRAIIRGSDSRHRRLAGMRLIQEDSVLLVQCLVRVQRLDTTERAMFARQRGDDRPTDTPIDRPGAGSTIGREEWVDVGRDRQLEKEVLDAIEREVSMTRPAI